MPRYLRAQNRLQKRCARSGRLPRAAVGTARQRERRSLARAAAVTAAAAAASLLARAAAAAVQAPRLPLAQRCGLPHPSRYPRLCPGSLRHSSRTLMLGHCLTLALALLLDFSTTNSSSTNSSSTDSSTSSSATTSTSSTTSSSVLHLQRCSVRGVGSGYALTDLPRATTTPRKRRQPRRGRWERNVSRLESRHLCSPRPSHSSGGKDTSALTTRQSCCTTAWGGCNAREEHRYKDSICAFV